MAVAKASCIVRVASLPVPSESAGGGDGSIRRLRPTEALRLQARSVFLDSQLACRPCVLLRETLMQSEANKPKILLGYCYKGRGQL